MIEKELNAELTRHTTFGIPATAAVLVRWDDEDDLRAILADTSLPRPLKIVGGGSNLLFTRPFEGTVLLRAGRPEFSINPDTLEMTADAHCVLDDLCAATAARGLRGLENLSAIPGTLGGAITQDAGAYGSEIGDAFISARLMDMQTGDILEVDRTWMHFGYRTSRLKEEPGRYVVLDARLQLQPADSPARLDYPALRQVVEGENPSAEEIREAVVRVRNSKLPDPKETGSAGSFFRNPEVDPSLLQPEMPRYMLPNGLAKVPAAWLIAQCGLKGARKGGAMAWQTQPLVIVNAEGHATAADVLDLEQTIVDAVRSRFGITLTPEVEHI